MNALAEVFITFVKIGLFTFGGGYAMIPIIEDICVDTKKWITHDEMMNITIVAESTPGPIAINCATFVGYKKKGLAGAIMATFGVILPSLVIIYLISRVLDNFLEYSIVANAFKGIKIAVGILILDASLRMIKQAKKNILSYIILCFGAVAMLAINIFSLSFSSVGLMLVAGVTGLSVYVVSGFFRKAGEKR